MVIVVVRSGGVAGMTRRASVDTTAMDEGTGWQRLVDRALPLLTSLPESPNTAIRDSFQWRLEIGEYSCETGDSSLTGPLRELAERTLKEGRRP